MSARKPAKPAARISAAPARAVRRAADSKPAEVAGEARPARTRSRPPAKAKPPAETAGAVLELPRKTPAGKKKKARAEALPAASGDGTGALVIVESPAKSRTLSKFLGRGFTVLASNGHIMDLPKSKLGVDIDNDFEPEYVPIRAKNQALAKIQIAARKAARIYLAPDPDREGEAIAWHLASQLKGVKRPVRRLTFNEITQRAVTEALKNPRDLDMNLVNAQQARRVLDRLIGYKVSPFVWSTVKYGLAAGRVQSVALRLICDRETEIQAFVAEEYWTIEVDYETPAHERFTARLVRVDDDKLENGQLRESRR